MSSSSTFKFLLLSFIFVALTSAEDDSHPKGMVTKEKWDVHVTLNKSGGESEILDLTCQDDSHCQNYAINSKTSSCVNGKCVCQQKNFNQSVSCGNLSKIKMKIVGSSCEAAEPFCGSLADASCDDKSNTCICKDGYVESVDKRKCLAGEFLMKTYLNLKFNFYYFSGS